MRAHSVTVRLDSATGRRSSLPDAEAAAAGPLGAEAVFGRMRSNVAHWHLVDSHGVTYALRGATWGECPSSFRLAGTRSGPDGFWLCVRSDLAARRFYVGNVVKGSASYYRVQSGRVGRLPVRAPVLLSGDEQAHRAVREPGGLLALHGAALAAVNNSGAPLS